VSNPLRHVVVLGGGSAGWLVAGLLAAEHGGANGSLRVTLIESSEAPPIGVGEGTWPSMRDTLRRSGIAEVDLIRECDASFKQGSRFDGWAGGPAAAAGDHYYHPFSLPTGHGEADLVGAWLAGPAGRPFADVVSPQPQVCAAGLAPKQTATPAYAAVANYAYHFDAGKFGQLLRRHAVEQLGVRHVVSHVEEVVGAPDGGIAALRTRSAGDVAGDLFIDCSGLPSLLIGQHFGVPLVEQRGVLFNDAALAMQVPYARPDAPLASCTLATAWSKGWIWDIGLPQRRGVGVVYASRHASQDEAAQALRHYLRATGAPSELPAMRPIAFTPGYRERFWVKNCVAIGLSSGFIEPLEASALALVELSAQWLSEMLPASCDALPTLARRFNDVFSYRWARVIDFLKLHYALSRRDDSAYWREHRDPASWPESLRELLPLWRQRPPSRLDFGRIDEVFPAASYQYVLYGMGFRPESAGNEAAARDAASHLQDAARLAQRMLAGLPPHRALIDHIVRSGLPLI
jgi:hypothetical protein